LQKIFSDMLLVTGNVWVSQFIQNFLPSAANCFFFWIAAKVIFLIDSMAAIAFAAASIALIAAVSWWSDSVRRQGSIDFPVFRDYLRSCTAAFGVTIAGLGITAVSPLILGMYADKEQVAIFTVASRLALIASLITLSVQNISMGKFAIAFSSNNNNLLRQHASQSAGLTLALCAFFLVPCVIFSEELMRLFGENYVAGAPVLVILCIGQLVASIFGPVNAVLLMTGHERQVRNFSGLMMILGVFLHFILVPKYGAIGAAIASSLAFVAAIFILAFVVRKRLGFWPTLNFLR
jgi:O-antigen/teichoic acid export membrane protein